MAVCGACGQRGARWETQSVFHGKRPGLPKANCPQIHGPVLGFGVAARNPFGQIFSPCESKERHADFSLTARTVAWAHKPAFCKDGYE